MSKLPLEGIRVVEVTTAWAGPGAAMILGDLGAEVIRVDFVNFWQSNTRGNLARPTKDMLTNQVPFTGGYPNKEPGKHPWNVWPTYTGQARNKLGMTLRDLKEPKSRELFLRLIKMSDIFIENNQPETLDKLGINYEVLRTVRPDIILVRLPACGTSGSYANFRTHGQVLDALGGHLSVRGYSDMGPEANTFLAPADYLGALSGAFGAMLALFHRYKTGKGQVIECGQVETLPLCLGEAMMDYFMNQRVHTRIGNQSVHGAAPCGCYRCQGEDDWVNITITSEGEWQRFKKVLGNPPWTEEERFSNVYIRWENQGAMDKLIEKWTMQHDKYDVMQVLQKEGIAAGPVMSAADSYHDPHLRARGFFEKVTHEDAGTHLYPGMAWKFSKTPLSIRRPPVRFGEHNEYVYKHIIGVSDEEYAELIKQGEISDEPAPDIP